MGRSSRFALGAVLVGLAVAFGLGGSAQADAAYITYAGGKSYNHQKITSFRQIVEGPPFVMLSAVTSKQSIQTSNAYWESPPYLPTPMLATALYFTHQVYNPAGLNWGVNYTAQLVGVASSLNSLLQSGYWAYGWGAPPYSAGCSILPWPHQCWKANPDYLLSTSVTYRVDYGVTVALPWLVLSGNTGTLAGVWW